MRRGEATRTIRVIRGGDGTPTPREMSAPTTTTKGFGERARETD
jgi:hypothetical protein